MRRWSAEREEIPYWIDPTITTPGAPTRRIARTTPGCSGPATCLLVDIASPARSP